MTRSWTRFTIALIALPTALSAQPPTAPLGSGTFATSNAVGLGYELVILVLLAASFAAGLAFVLWVRPSPRDKA